MENKSTNSLKHTSPQHEKCYFVLYPNTSPKKVETPPFYRKCFLCDYPMIIKILNLGPFYKIFSQDAFLVADILA